MKLLSLQIQLLLLLLLAVTVPITNAATAQTKTSSITSRYSPDNIPIPPVPASWPTRSNFVGLTAEEVIAKVHTHVDKLHNEHPAFRNKNTRAQPSYVKDLLYIEMLAQQGELLQAVRTPIITEASTTSSFLSVSTSRSLLGSRLRATEASKNKFGFVKKAAKKAAKAVVHHAKKVVAVVSDVIDTGVTHIEDAHDTYMNTMSAVGMVIDEVNPCRSFNQQYDNQLNIKTQNKQKIENLEEREIIAEAQKERLQASALSVQDHCKCNPSSGKCLIGPQIQHEIVLLEHEGEQIKVAILKVQHQIHAVDNVENGAIQALKAANPECGAIQEFYDWISVIGNTIKTVIDDAMILIQVLICISIEITIAILGAAIDVAVMTSFPAVLTVQATPLCLFVAGDIGGALWEGSGNEAMVAVAGGVEQGIAMNFHMSARSAGLDNIAYHTAELGAALVKGDPPAIIVRLFFFAVFGMKELGRFLDDNAIGGVDDTMREIAEQIENERWVAEFVVSVLLDSLCGKFGSAISTTLTALAECNLCGTIDCRGNCPTAAMAFVDACKDDGTSSEDSDEWILVHGGNGRQSYQPLYEGEGNFAPTTSELLTCTNEGFHVEHPAKEDVAPSAEKWIAPCAKTCNDDARCNAIWLEESGRCCTYRTYHDGDKMTKAVSGKYFIRVADPELRATAERVAAATLIDLNTPADCPTVFCTSDFAGKKSLSAIAEEKQQDEVGDCAETSLASFNDKQCLGGVCKVMTVEGCKQLCQSHSECSIISYSSNIEQGGCKLYSDTCTVVVSNSDFDHWTISHVPMDTCPAHLPICTSRGHCMIPGSSTTAAVVALSPSTVGMRGATSDWVAAPVAAPVAAVVAAPAVAGMSATTNDIVAATVVAPAAVATAPEEIEKMIEDYDSNYNAVIASAPDAVVAAAASAVAASSVASAPAMHWHEKVLIAIHGLATLFE